VFETLLVRERRIQALEPHLRRLAHAVADLYGEPLPSDLRMQVQSAAAGLAGAHRLRVSAAPGQRVVAIEIASEPLVLPDPENMVKLRPVGMPGGLGAYKWSDRRLLDRHDDGRSVALIVDESDEALEAAWANIWILEGRRILTPPADGRLLEGVTRGLLLEISVRLGLEAAAEPIPLSRARAADAIFLTSSLRHAVGATLDHHPARDNREAAIRMIRTALDEICWEG
jgi:para-aminobenzoate synthetase / 4-amino-4-deoxychorismate lyase